MKYLATIILAVSILSISCSTLTNTKSANIKVVSLPNSTTSFDLSFTEEDIEVLGQIDIRKEMRFKSSDRLQIMKDENKVEYYGYIDVLQEKKSKIQDDYNRADEITISSAIYDAIMMYPEMDYILFPKILKEISYIKGKFGEYEKIVNIRLLGKAIKLKM